DNCRYPDTRTGPGAWGAARHRLTAGFPAQRVAPLPEGYEARRRYPEVQGQSRADARRLASLPAPPTAALPQCPPRRSTRGAVRLSPRTHSVLRTAGKPQGAAPRGQLDCRNGQTSYSLRSREDGVLFVSVAC